MRNSERLDGERQSHPPQPTQELPCSPEFNLPVVMQVSDVSVYYGEKQAVKDISMPVHQQKVTALIGASGCGKSTLLWALNRMHEMNSSAQVLGSVLLKGVDIYQKKFLRGYTLSGQEVRSKIGMIFQKPEPFPKSIFENVVFGLRLLGRQDQKQLKTVAEEALCKAGLWEEVKNDWMKKSGMALSGGQQQRMCIARAIAIQPEVLLMDEPTSSLDPIAAAKIEDLIRELSTEYTVVIVTHNMQQAQRIADFTAHFHIDETRTGVLEEFGLTHQVFNAPKSLKTDDFISGRFS